MACVWLPQFLFFIFYLSIVCYKQLVQFLWLIFIAFVDSIFLLAPHFQYIQPEIRTFHRIRVFGIFFFFFDFSIVVSRTKSNRWAAENQGQILLLKQLKSDWFFLVSFVFSANQKPFVICSRVTSLHSCYRRTALLSQPIRIEKFFRVYYYRGVNFHAIMSSSQGEKYN